MARWFRFAVPLWSAALSLLICAPLLAPGFALTYDMVWVPDLDVTRSDVWGLGSALPRAVPSDAVVALLNMVIPGSVLQKLILLGALFAAGVGMGRMLSAAPLVARLAALTLYVWNPFVAERLVLGHWPVLVAYAAVPWLISSVRTADGPRRPATLIALAATALSPATGLMGAVIAFVCKGKGNNFLLAVSVVAVNAPWVVAGLLHATISRTDSGAVVLFDVQPEGSLGRLGAAMSLGGIWNSEVVPVSRTMVIALILAVVVWAVTLVGLVELWQQDRRLLVGLTVAGVLGLALALSGWLAEDVMTTLVREVPAAGLLRDGTRYLLLLAPLLAVGFGHGVQRLVTLVREAQARQFVAVIAILVPLIALPDLAWGVGGKIKAADYPESWNAARSAISASTVPGDIVVLPFLSYRKPSWNHGQSVLDPAGRYFDRESVVNDELLVSGVPIAGEDPRAEQIAHLLTSKSPARGLARAGIGIVVVETDAAPVKPAQLAGMKRIYKGDGIEVLSIANAQPTEIDDRDFYLMIGAWLVGFLALCSGLTRLVLQRLKR